MSHYYKVVVRFGPGVDTQFSHESGKMCEDDNILQEHSPWVMVQVDSLFCTMSIQIKEHSAKRSKVFGES